MNDIELKNIKEPEFRKYKHNEVHGIAESFMEKYKFITIENDRPQKEVYKYEEHLGYYIPNGISKINKMCSMNCMTSYKAFTDALVKIVCDRTSIPIEDFINPHSLVNLKNGTFNLESNNLMKHDSSYMFRSSLNIDYCKNTKCPLWERSLKGMFNDEEDYIRTQKWYGYQFVRENREQIAHGYYGESGSGKSKILMILRELLGGGFVTNFQLQELGNPNLHAIARLHGKLANINYDMSTAELKDISLFKSLTSGEPISGRNLYKDHFEFINYAKLTWACNKLPVVSNEILSSREFTRRIMLTNVKKGHTIDDKDILHKFKKELPGIFNWVVEGYNLYLKEGFKYNKNISSEWEDNMDSRDNLYNNHKVVTELEKLKNDKITIYSDLKNIKTRIEYEKEENIILELENEKEKLEKQLKDYLNKELEEQFKEYTNKKLNELFKNKDGIII